jgi:hypothetical protein
MGELGALPTAVLGFLERDHRAERCPPDRAYATAVLDRIISNECEDVLHAAAQERWVKANTYGYDGARKAIEAWLLATGWRIRPVAGSHAAIVDVVHHWLGASDEPGPRISRSLGAARKARHDDEYPSPAAPERTDRELRALVMDSARLINLVRQELGLVPRVSIVPTETTLEARPER